MNRENVKKSRRGWNGCGEWRWCWWVKDRELTLSFFYTDPRWDKPREHHSWGRQRTERPSTLFLGANFSPLLEPQPKSTVSSHHGTDTQIPAPSSVGVVAGPVQGTNMNPSPWLKRTDGVRREAFLRDSEAKELSIPVRAACNVWLNFLSN